VLARDQKAIQLLIGTLVDPNIKAAAQYLFGSDINIDDARSKSTEPEVSFCKY